MKKNKRTESEDLAEEQSAPSPEAAPGADAPADDALSLPRLRDERDRLDAQLKRTMADLSNIRRRQARELDEARQRAIEVLAAELLPVLDNFHLALAAHEQQESGAVAEETHSMIAGLRMVRGLLEGVLARHGLAEIRAHGEPFDPMRHEAVGIDAESTAAPGQITKVVQRGYRLGDKVLRASRVLVSGASGSDGESGGGPDAGSDGGQGPAGSQSGAPSGRREDEDRA